MLTTEEMIEHCRLLQEGAEAKIKELQEITRSEDEDDLLDVLESAVITLNELQETLEDTL